MSNNSVLERYFAENRPKPRYEFGERVFGYHQGIPFMGKVGADRLLNDEIGPQVSINLDLPISLYGKRTHVINVTYDEIKCRTKSL